MIVLGFAHIPPCFIRGDRHTLPCKHLYERIYRCSTAEIDHGSGPIKHHRLDGKFHAATPSMPKRSLITLSAMPNPVEAPVPLVTITSRTFGSGASIR